MHHMQGRSGDGPFAGVDSYQTDGRTVKKPWEGPASNWVRVQSHSTPGYQEEEQYKNCWILPKHASAAWCEKASIKFDPSNAVQIAPRNE